jgi:hypothetical protein
MQVVWTFALKYPLLCILTDFMGYVSRTKVIIFYEVWAYILWLVFCFHHHRLPSIPKTFSLVYFRNLIVLPFILAIHHSGCDLWVKFTTFNYFLGSTYR